MFKDFSPMILVKKQTWKYSEIIPEINMNSFRNKLFSTTGIVNQVLQLRIFFDGAERDSYESAFGGLALNLKPNDQTRLRFQTSAY